MFTQSIPTHFFAPKLKQEIKAERILALKKFKYEMFRDSDFIKRAIMLCLNETFEKPVKFFVDPNFNCQHQCISIGKMVVHC